MATTPALLDFHHQKHRKLQHTVGQLLPCSQTCEDRNELTLHMIFSLYHAKQIRQAVSGRLSPTFPSRHGSGRDTQSDRQISRLSRLSRFASASGLAGALSPTGTPPPAAGRHPPSRGRAPSAGLAGFERGLGSNDGQSSANDGELRCNCCASGVFVTQSGSFRGANWCLCVPAGRERGCLERAKSVREHGREGQKGDFAGQDKVFLAAVRVLMAPRGVIERQPRAQEGISIAQRRFWGFDIAALAALVWHPEGRVGQGGSSLAVAFPFSLIEVVLGAHELL